MIEKAPDRSRSAADQARELLGQNRAADAARLMEQYLRENVGSATDQMLLGIALAQSGDWMMAVQHLEEAVSLDPRNAAAYHNLGLVYRQGKRDREALAAFERALALRPNYPAAAKAASETRAQIARATVPETTAAPTAGAPEPYASASQWQELEEEPGPIWRRLLAAMGQLLFSPGAALGGGLDRFFGSPGAIGAVLTLFVLSLGVSGFIASVSPSAGAQTAAPSSLSSAPFVILAGIAVIVVSAAFIALFNVITSRSQGFIGEFGSLALSLALVSATLTLAIAPIHLILALAGSISGIIVINIIATIWSLILEVAVVESMTEIGWLLAFILLVVAYIVGAFVATVAAGVLAIAVAFGM